MDYTKYTFYLIDDTNRISVEEYMRQVRPACERARRIQRGRGVDNLKGLVGASSVRKGAPHPVLVLAQHLIIHRRYSHSIVAGGLPDTS